MTNGYEKMSIVRMEEFVHERPYELTTVRQINSIPIIPLWVFMTSSAFLIRILRRN